MDNPYIKEGLSESVQDNYFEDKRQVKSSQGQPSVGSGSMVMNVEEEDEEPSSTPPSRKSV